MCLQQMQIKVVIFTIKWECMVTHKFKPGQNIETANNTHNIDNFHMYCLIRTTKIIMGKNSR
jgi:hypothetical protein